MAALPAGAFATRTLVACDDSDAARTFDVSETFDATDTVLIDTAVLDTVVPDTTVLDTAPPDSRSDIAEPDVALDAVDTIDDTAADATADTTADATRDDAPDAERVCIPTTPDAQGPFYLAGAPALVDLAGTTPGSPIALTGQVTDVTCAAIPGAHIEVWQADSDGDYHDDILRATLTCNADGAYAFTSIMPGRYLQATGLRPAHLHYRVTAPGYRTLVTQIYFAGDPYLQPNDSCTTCASDDPARIVELHTVGGRDTARLDITLGR